MAAPILDSGTRVMHGAPVPAPIASGGVLSTLLMHSAPGLALRREIGVLCTMRRPDRGQRERSLGVSALREAAGPDLRRKSWTTRPPSTPPSSLKTDHPICDYPEG